MMPTSPAGKNNTRQNHQAGFTLVEVLAVLFIISMMVGAVVMSLPAKQDPLHVQGKLLADRIQMTAQSGLMENQPVGVSFTEHGYSVVKYNFDIWEIVEEFEFDAENEPVLVLTQNTAKIDLEAAAKSETPVIRYDTTGLGTPFVLHLQSGASRFVITGAIDGSITAEPET